MQQCVVIVGLLSGVFRNKNLFDALVYITPSTESHFFLKLICFFCVETHKVSTSIRGGFHVLLHKPRHGQVPSARSSCTAPERVRK